MTPEEAKARRRFITALQLVADLSSDVDDEDEIVRAIAERIARADKLVEASEERAYQLAKMRSEAGPPRDYERDRGLSRSISEQAEAAKRDLLAYINATWDERSAYAVWCKGEGWCPYGRDIDLYGTWREAHAALERWQKENPHSSYEIRPVPKPSSARLL